MKELFQDLAKTLAPALKDAFTRAAKVAAYIVLSAAITAAYAYLEGKSFDPSVLFIVNTALAAFQRALESLKEQAVVASHPEDPGFPPD